MTLKIYIQIKIRKLKITSIGLICLIGLERTCLIQYSEALTLNWAELLISLNKNVNSNRSTYCMN